MPPYSHTYDTDDNARTGASGAGGVGGSLAVVVVDPTSTGWCVAREISRRGYNLVAVWSDAITDKMKRQVPSSCSDVFLYAEVNEGPTVHETARRVREAAPFDVAACVCGGETGTALSDALSEALGLRSTDGTTEGPVSLVGGRRNKKAQQELIKAKGLRSTRQAAGKEFEGDVESFLRKEAYPVIVKPVESTSRDGVKLCRTFEEAKEHFLFLRGSSSGEVLCQEFLRGKEYAVDNVTKDGIHKTTMLWTYDKRSANGSEFVYFGCVPVDSETEEAKLIVQYVRSVLDALGARDGATHTEVMMTEDGPCLVEMNCRTHGGDGNWIPLARALTGGYSQVDALVDSHLNPEAFDRLPSHPPSPFKAAGQKVLLVSKSEGIVKSTPGFEVIRRLPSFVSLETRLSEGRMTEYTVDLLTAAGSVVLVHRDAEVVERDVEFVRYMEDINGLFAYETEPEYLKRPRAAEDEMFPLPLVAEESRDDGTKEGPPGPLPLRRAYSLDSRRRHPIVRHFSNDRPELQASFAPLVKRPTTVDASREVVILVDPYSTGACIAREILNRGYNVIALWSHNIDKEMREHIPASVGDETNGGGALNYLAELTEEGTLERTASMLKDTIVTGKKKKLEIVACLAGAEFGVPLADSLSELLNVRTNGTAVLRRDKKVQQDLVRDAGLRAVRQAAGSNLEEVEPFLRKESYPVVVKPVESAGSDGVQLCHTYDEARQHFLRLSNARNQCGGINSSVLCQEFLRGKEYVVDQVSRNGVHKTTMVWVYDKRPANGAAFVYFGCVPVDSQSPEAQLIIPYVRSVLDALGVKNGPSHGEVMMTPSGPCLVEMNVRAHGGDGNWMPLVRALTGYSQVDASVDAYLDEKRFGELPDRPPSPFRAAGQEVILVSYSRGTVNSTPGFDAIRRLESFLYLETSVEIGSKVERTTDLFTCIGSAILVHPDADAVERDIRRIREMEENDELFVYEAGGGRVGGGELFRSPSVLNQLSFSSDLDAVAEKGDLSPSAAAPPAAASAHRRVISSDRMDIFW